ncbi:MAG: response regulator transcription factor [Bacillota bacterium]|nr:response regulator transcription factor [Bacillota bacterium]
MNTKILIVEDDRMLNEGIAYALRKKEYLVYSAGTLEEAETYLNQSVNLVILDINLPDGDGREFLKKVRGNNPAPVLLLTARDTEQDMLQGFAVGCDDYVTKPFSMAVLLCRIEVLLKHVGNMEGQFYYCGTLAYDFKEKLLRKGESFVKLTATEIRLLEVFLKHRNQVLTREQLLGLVWDAYENYVDEKTLNVNIRRLREKIEDDPKEPVYIKTVFGIGYKWSDKV